MRMYSSDVRIEFRNVATDGRFIHEGWDDRGGTMRISAYRALIVVL